MVHHHRLVPLSASSIVMISRCLLLRQNMIRKRRIELKRKLF